MAYDSNELVFHECYLKLKTLQISDVNKLNNLIDQLNSLNFSQTKIDLKEAEDLFCQIIKLVPKGNDHLLTKFCSLVYLFLNKQERNLSPLCVQSLTEFFISSVLGCDECFLSDILIGFSALLSENGDKVEKFHSQLMGKNGILTDLISLEKHDKNVQFCGFQCVLHLLSKNPDSFVAKEYLDICYEKCILMLKRSITQKYSDLLDLKILMSSIKCLHLLSISKNVQWDNLGELLGILKCLLFYGLPGPAVNDFFLLPTLPTLDIKQLEDSQGESDSTAYPKLRKQKRVRRTKQKKTPQKKEQEEEYENANSNKRESSALSSPSPSSSRAFYDLKIKSSSSDSEYSDAESTSSKLKSYQATVRQLAYQVLQAVIKNADKKVIFGYWSSFLPDHPDIPGMTYGQNIFTTILKDPNPQVRLCALVFLTEVLRGSKPFLSVADGKSARHSSFTSLSSIIATILNELHRCLLLALLSENTSLLLTQILKCYAVLCENTPYSKLNDEILLKIIKHIKGFIHHKDTQVQVASLIVFQFIIKSDQVPENIGSLLISPDFDSAFSNYNKVSIPESVSVDDSNEIPWLVYICKKNIFGDEPLAMRIESVQLLSCIVGKYFSKIYPSLQILAEVIMFCLSNADPSLQLHGAKLLDVFGRCVANSTESNMREENYNQIKKLWFDVVTGPFHVNMSTIDDSQKPLIAVCCDCLSTLPGDVFEELPPKQQIFYITVLLGFASDPHSNVRGAAVRCLGVFCLFPSLIKDFSFISDVSEILIKCVKDPVLTVRFKASWSMGKLSDALFETNTSTLQDQISENFFYSTAMACVQYSKDCDKVRTNSVRALGIFLYHVPQKWMGSSKISQFVTSASLVLQSALTTSTMKVCWNVCYAYGKMLKNSYLAKQGLVEFEDVLNTLINCLKSSNFKVRISASQALTVMESRELYGSLFPKVWLQLLNALSSINTDVNFKEIKHQENLSDQICYSLCQLASLISLQDVSIISQETLESSEVLFTSMWKFGSRTSSDKINDIYSAIEHLQLLNTEEDAKNTRLVLSALQDILNQVTIAFYGQDLTI